MSSALSYIVYRTIQPSSLDALIGYFTPSHVIHKRLLLQFLSAPEDGRKKRLKHVEYSLIITQPTNALIVCHLL